jgi:O-antigen/teichoic acid export membrane protein
VSEQTPSPKSDVRSPAAALVARAGEAAGLLWRSRMLIRLRPFDISNEEGRSLERYRRIALTTLSGFTLRVATTSISLVTVPLVLAYLGKERYGLWNTITTVVAWVALFDLGLSNGLVNCLSRAYGRDDHDEASRYFTTALAAMAGLAIVLGVGLILVVPRVSWSAFLGARGTVDDATVTWSVAAALGAFVITMPLAVVPQLYAGFQRSYVTNTFNLLGSLLGFAALVLALRASLGMPLLILAFSAGSVVSSGLGLAYALGPGMPWLRIGRGNVSRSALQALFERSFPMFLFQVGALAVNETQSIILAQRCGLATVAEYGIAFRFYLLIAGLIQLGTNSFIPPLREAHERGDRAWTRVAFRRVLAIRLGLAGTGAAGMLLLGNVILRVWLRRSDITFDWKVWAMLAVLQVTAAWVSSYTELLWIMDRLWVLVGLVAINGAVTIGLTWTLVPRRGVFGAFLAVSAVTVLVNTWVVPLLARKVLRDSGGGV